MTELDKLIKAAEAHLSAIDELDAARCAGEHIIANREYIDSIEDLRQAVEQAKVVEAVEEQYKCCKVFDDGDVSYAWATETEIENMHKWEKVVPEVKRDLYTTPPSVDALIAEIDGLGKHTFPESQEVFVRLKKLSDILDKYRARGE